MHFKGQYYIRDYLFIRLITPILMLYSDICYCVFD
jgi:hypothetical protein